MIYGYIILCFQQQQQQRATNMQEKYDCKLQWVGAQLEQIVGLKQRDEKRKSHNSTH